MRLRRIGKNQKIDLLKGVSLFQRCTKKQLAEVASIADEMHFEAGKALIREGQRGREFFVILDGDVAVTKGGKALRKKGPGDFFGEIALVSHVPRTATVTTTTPVRALVVTDRDFRQLLENAPDIEFKVLEALAERLAELLPEH